MKRLVIIAILAFVSSEAYCQNPAEALKRQEQHATLQTLRRITPDSTFYTMEYDADYRLDAFLKAGIDSPTKLGKTVAMKLMKPLKALQISKGLDMGCSAFSTRNSEGDILVGRNFDYPHKRPALILLKCNPKNGYSSMGMVTMAFLGLHAGDPDDGKSDISFAIAAPYMTMDGINEKGFSVSVLALKSEDARQTEQGKGKIMTSVAIRMMLDRAATVDEAISLMKCYNFYSNADSGKRRSYNYHFFLSDSTGKSAVLEYIKVDGKWTMNVIDTDHVTNFYLSEGWQEIGGGKDRFEKIEEKKKEVMDPKEVMDVLRYVSADGSSESKSTTQWSVVYNLTRLTAEISILRDYEKSYRFDNADR